MVHLDLPEHPAQRGEASSSPAPRAALRSNARRSTGRDRDTGIVARDRRLAAPNRSPVEGYPANLQRQRPKSRYGSCAQRAAALFPAPPSAVGVSVDRDAVTATAPEASWRSSMKPPEAPRWRATSTGESGGPRRWWNGNRVSGGGEGVKSRRTSVEGGRTTDPAEPSGPTGGCPLGSVSLSREIDLNPQRYTPRS